MRQIVIKKCAAEVAKEAAALFHQIADRSIAKRGVFSVALSGGSTPGLLYRLLVSEYHGKLPWDKIKFFFGDERNVPSEDKESNYRMAREAILGPLEIADQNVFRWRTELGVAAAADEYEKQLRQTQNLDLVLLGLGADAHTASLFPNTAAVRETRRLAITNWVDKLNDFRLTMTFPAINSAESVIFLVTGDEKADAVRNVLQGEFRPDDYPAQMAQPVNGKLYWLVDETAASKVTTA